MSEQEPQVETAGIIEDPAGCFEAPAFVPVGSPLISPCEVEQKFGRSGRLSHWELPFLRTYVLASSSVPLEILFVKLRGSSTSTRSCGGFQVKTQAPVFARGSLTLVYEL